VNEEPGGGYQKHGHTAETLSLAAVAALGFEAVLPAAGVPGWVLPATEIIASAGTALVTWSGTGRLIFPAYLTVLGGFLGGWTIWAQDAGLWHWNVLGGLVAGMAALIPAGVGAWHRRHRKPAPFGLPPAILASPEVIQIGPDENELEMRRFEMMLTDFGIGTEESPVTVTSLTEERSGRVVAMTLPLSGKFTIEDCRNQARHLEIRLRAQEGAVTFEGGAHSGNVVMKIRERDGLATGTSLTPELRATTVNKPFCVGDQEDGTPQMMTVREVHTMIVGTTGSGKSNLLNVIIAQLAYCPDTIIWVIDMKGGRFARPWFQAWGEGHAAMPAIDWLATTRAEAETIMRALPVAVDVRARSGLGGNKIIPSPSMPQIMLVCDEMAVLFGSERGGRNQVGQDRETNTWFGSQAVEVGQMGRSEAVGTIWAGLRGTASVTGPSDLKAVVDQRIALRPSSEAELLWSIPDAYFAAKQLTYLGDTPGVGVMARGKQVSQIIKFIHHDHIEGVCGADQGDPRCPAECPVYRSSVETAPIRPRLDRMTAQALGASYAQRWVRASRDGAIKVPVAALSAGSAAYSGGGDSSRFDSVIAGLEDPEREVHPARTRIREYLSGRGRNGDGVRQIMTMLDHEFGAEAPVRETVHRWLAEDREEKLLHHPGYRRWVWGPGPNVEGE
jgi:FtsK/SpoIIIE family